MTDDIPLARDRKPLERMEDMENELRKVGKLEEVVEGYSKAAPHIKAAMRTFEHVTECPMCGGTDFKDYEPADLIWKYYECECGMVFQTSYMPKGALDWYYKDVYRLCVRPYSADVEPDSVFKETDSAIKYLLRAGPRPCKRHLDIGSSTGSFLRTTNVAYECEVMGVEPVDAYRDYSRERGIPTFKDISDVEGKFDFISLCHVLEHLINPMEMLAAVKDLLEDGGYLYVEVPRLGYTFSHPLVFKDVEVLTMTLETVGFDIVNSSSAKKFMFANAVAVARTPANAKKG